MKTLENGEFIQNKKLKLILTKLVGYNKIILKVIPTKTVWIRFLYRGDNIWSCLLKVDMD